jgi:tetratricopeptide (TPR) repeat protein
MARTPLAKLALCAALLLGLLTGCGQRQPAATPEQRYTSAKALFEKASRDYHIPSAEARGAERRNLEDQAAAIYAEVAKEYTDQPVWASQALRSLGNIRAAQTNINEAVKLYVQVGERFPKHDFEVLMAWKAAADLLADSGRAAEAKGFYEKIVARFDRPDALPIVQSVVRGSKARLKSELLLSRNSQ